MNKKKVIFFIITIFVGYLLGYYAFKYKNECNLYESDKGIFEGIVKLIESHPNSSSLRESLIVRLANKCNITMFGRQINDTLTDKNIPGRRKYDMHPYGKAGVSVSALVTYTDKKTKEVYILLGRKYKNPSDPSQGLANQLVLFAGYMKPHPLEGTIPGIENISDEEKDIAEEAILRGKDGYEQIMKDHKNEETSPAEEESYDINLESTAIRELYEESGLLWTFPEPSKLISVRSTYGMTGKRLHTVIIDYLFDYGVCSSAPKAKAGSDIAEVFWVKLKDVQKDFSVEQKVSSNRLSRYSVMLDGTPIPILDAFGPVIENYANSVGISLKKFS